MTNHRSRALVRARRALVAAMIAALALPVSRADAQVDAKTASADAKAAAQQKMAQGAQLLEQGQPAEALALFKEAYAQVQNPRYQYNIGVACQALGRDAEALQAFQTFGANAQGVRQEYIDDAQKQIEVLRDRVAKVVVTSSVPGATVLVDGRDVGQTPLSQSLVLDAGEHRFIVRKLSFEPFERVVNLKRGDRLDLAADLHPVAARVVETAAPVVVSTTPAPEPESAPSSPIYKRWWLWTAIGAAVVTGVVVSLTVHSRSEGPQCPPNIPCLTP
jgi:tetratricopeptide (TPR) repeat protein